MSGHSKWSTIKRQKGTNDAKRGAAFTKLGNAITIAVHEGGGGDPNFNFKLRLAMDKAREANMPKENIQRSIDRGTGRGDVVVLENVLFEGFAPNGVAVLVDSVTDNKSRTMGEVRTIFTKSGGSLGGSGSVGYLFKHKGEIIVNKVNEVNKASNAIKLDEILEKAMEAEAEDVVEDDLAYIIYTRTDNLHQVKEKLESQGLKIESAQLVYAPNMETQVQIPDPAKEQQVVKLLESLEELDDVQNVYSNLG